MSMIKRGHSDNARPSVISSGKKCESCGYSDSSSHICPHCQGRMISIVMESIKDDNDRFDGDCPGGVCNLDK